MFKVSPPLSGGSQKIHSIKCAKLLTSTVKDLGYFVSTRHTSLNWNLEIMIDHDQSQKIIWWFFVTFDDYWWFFMIKSGDLFMIYHDWSWQITIRLGEVGLCDTLVNFVFCPAKLFKGFMLGSQKSKQVENLGKDQKNVFHFLFHFLFYFTHG